MPLFVEGKSRLPPRIVERLIKKQPEIFRDLEKLGLQNDEHTLCPIIEPAYTKVLAAVDKLDANYIPSKRREKIRYDRDKELGDILRLFYETIRDNNSTTVPAGKEIKSIPAVNALEEVLETINEINKRYLSSETRQDYLQQLREILTGSK